MFRHVFWGAWQPLSLCRFVCRYVREGRASSRPLRTAFLNGPPGALYLKTPMGAAGTWLFGITYGDQFPFWGGGTSICHLF